jgi:hypothetical protein
MGWFGLGGASPQLQNPSLRMLQGSDSRNAKAVIEGVDASGKTQWIDATPGNLKTYGMDPRSASPEAIGRFDARQKEQADRGELRQQQAARQGEDRRRFDAELGLRSRGEDRADRSTDATIKHNEGVLGIQQQAANTNELIAKSDADYKQGTLSLSERQRLDQNRQFDQTHLLAQQQNAMNYNLTATRLNNDIEAQNYDRRLRTMEGIGAAIAGLAAMIGG